MKKSIYIVMALLMLCAAIAFGVNAAEARPGETVQVSVDLSENPGLSYLGLRISYDSSVMTLKSADNTGVLNGGFTPGRSLSADPYVVNWSSADNMTGEGSILTLTFEVSPGAAEDTYPVSVEVADASNQDMEKVSVSAYASSVSVKHAPETTTETTTTKPPATTTDPETTTKQPETTVKPETTTKQPETTAKPGTTTGQTENGTKTGTSVTTTQSTGGNDSSVAEPLASTSGEAEIASSPSGVNAESETDTNDTVNSSRTGKVIGISVAVVVIVAAAAGVFFVIKKKRLAV